MGWCYLLVHSVPLVLCEGLGASRITNSGLEVSGSIIRVQVGILGIPLIQFGVIKDVSSWYSGTGANSSERSASTGNNSDWSLDETSRDGIAEIAAVSQRFQSLDNCVEKCVVGRLEIDHQYEALLRTRFVDSLATWRSPVIVVENRL